VKEEVNNSPDYENIEKYISLDADPSKNKYFF